MKWPFVNRALIEARDREITFLTRELDYWRLKFEGEKERADRAVDSAIEAAGREPISAPVRAEHKASSDIALAMQHEISEIFGDVASSVLNDPNAKSQEPESSETAGSGLPSNEPTIETRLAAIRASNAIRFPQAPATEESAA